MKPIQIYIGNDQTRDEAEMQKPKGNFFDDPEYELDSSAFYAYEGHIDNLARHKVIGPHSWKVGQRLEEGVDFKQVWYNYGGFDKPDNYGPAIIPIEGEQDETQDELLNDFIRNVKYMRDSYRNGRFSNAERWRDKLAEELDDIMRS